MTAAEVSRHMDDTEFASLRAEGFKLSKAEALFFQCLIDAIAAHGTKPPKGRSIPNDVGRVVDYDYVKLLMQDRLRSGDETTLEGRERHIRRVTAALRRPRETLMNFKIVASSNPYIWHTGKRVRGFRVLPGVTTNDVHPPERRASSFNRL